MNWWNWKLAGLNVTAMYMRLFHVSGRVLESRLIKETGDICHTIELDNPITIYGKILKRIFVQHNEITWVGNPAK